MGNIAAVEVTASVDEFKKAMASAASAFSQATREMGQATGEATAPLRVHGSVLDSVSEKLREHRTEHIQTTRAVGAFTKELEGLLGKGNEVAGMLGGLAGGFAMGGGFGLAVEGVKELAKAFGAAGREQGKWLDDAETRIGKVTEMVGDLALKLAGVSPAAARWSAIQTEIAAKQAEITRLEEEADETRRSQMAAGGEILGLDSKEAANLKEKVAKLREEAEALQKALDLRKAIDAQEEAEKNKTAQAKGADKVLAADKKRADEQSHIQAEQLQESIAAFAQNRDAQGKLQAQFDAKDLAADKWLEDQKAKGLEDAAKRAATIIKQQEAEQAALDAQAVATAMKVGKAWNSAAQSMGAEFGKAFAGMIIGSMSVAKAFATMAQAMVKAIVSAAIRSVEAYMVQAEAAAAASQAGIPLIGPVLAIGAIAMMGGVMEGLLGQLGSASGGYRVPDGMNPVTQLHSGEHVIPADIAQRYEQGAPGGGGDTFVFNLSGLDGPSIERVVRGPEFQRHLVRSVGDMRRNGRWP